MIRFIPVDTPELFLKAEHLIRPYEYSCVSLAETVRTRASDIVIAQDAEQRNGAAAVFTTRHTILHCVAGGKTENKGNGKWQMANGLGEERKGERAKGLGEETEWDGQFMAEFREALPEFLNTLRISCVKGTADGSSLFTEALAQCGKEPQQINTYTLMTLPERTEQLFSRDPHTADLFPEINEVRAETAVRLCSPSDATVLYPLHAAYIKEEVIPECRTYNDAVVRIEIEKLIAKQNMYMLVNASGAAISKGSVSAVGFDYALIGGMYTVPEQRGKNYARVLLSVIISDCLKKGKRPVLFVKNSNRSACSLYQSLGFIPATGYTISYY